MRYVLPKSLTWWAGLAAILIGLLALALPLLSQVVIDKVIVHRATSTLALIAAALAAVIAFSAAMSWVRQYLVIHTGNRIDAVLGAAVFRHLFALPLRYFERRPTGVVTARLAGIETIREFVSGAAVTLALVATAVGLLVARLRGDGGRPHTAAGEAVDRQRAGDRCRPAGGGRSAGARRVAAAGSRQARTDHRCRRGP